MIQPRQTQPPKVSGPRNGLPILGAYFYNGSGHDEIQPEECCAECMRAAKRIKWQLATSRKEG